MHLESGFIHLKVKNCQTEWDISREQTRSQIFLLREKKVSSTDWSLKPFASWLEQSIKELMEANPIAIAMEMVNEDGVISTCYYNTSPNDRACMIDAMADDARERWVLDNREWIKAVMDGEIDDDDCEGDVDEPCEAD